MRRLHPAVLLLAGGVAASGCRCTCSPRRDPALESQAFGNVSGKESAPVDLGAFLPLARAVVTRGDRSALPSRPNLPGRRVIVTLHPRRGAKVRGSGLGGSLEASVVAAAESIPEAQIPKEPFRIELEVLTLEEPIHFLDEKSEPEIEPQDVGLDGYAIAQKDAALGWVDPFEVVTLRAFKLGKQPVVLRDKLVPSIATRAGADRDVLATRKGYRFRTQAVVEASPGAGAIPLYRGWPEARPTPTPETLLAAVRAGADYLCRILSPQGKYIYMYRAGEDRDDASYGNLRHAGTTYALLEAYDELHEPLYLEKASAALTYMKGRLHTEVDASGAKLAYLIDGPGEEQQKVGGAGLAMVALAKRVTALRGAGPLAGPTPDVTGDLEELRALGRFIVHQQYPDGHFRANADVEKETGEQRKVKREVIYYTGEAILGLMRLYAIDPDSRWLDAAKRGADFVVKVRDANLSVDQQEHDHWMSYALDELERVAPDPAYVAHAWKIAKAIKLKQWSADDAPAPDFVGAFYAEAPSTPASTRLEAYDSDLKLARHLGEQEAWLLDPAKVMAGFTLAQQYDDARGFAVPNFDKAKGGVRESPLVLDVRIDYVQHAMSGWLHLARLLRDPSYGK